jgi:putative transposase
VYYLNSEAAVALTMNSDYPSSVSNNQWRFIKRLLPPAKKLGCRPIDRRRIIKAIFYWNRSGCQWRYLPKEFPNWNTVYGVFRGWKCDGTWKRIHDHLREEVRKASVKQATPTAGIIDSQSVRTAEGREFRGFDAGKKITGRKRHILVDTLGLIWMVVVHPADDQDYEGAHYVLNRIRQTYRRLKIVFADSAYGRCGLPDWVKEKCDVTLQTILRPVELKGFQVLPKRWIVERTFAWINRHRRLSKDYERLIDTSEAAIHIAMIDFMSRWLATGIK